MTRRVGRAKASRGGKSSRGATVPPGEPSGSFEKNAVTELFALRLDLVRSGHHFASHMVNLAAFAVLDAVDADGPPDISPLS